MDDARSDDSFSVPTDLRLHLVRSNHSRRRKRRDVIHQKREPERQLRVALQFAAFRLESAGLPANARNLSTGGVYTF